MDILIITLLYSLSQWIFCPPALWIKDIATTLKYDVETLENNPTVVECVENGNAIFRCNLLSTQVDKALNSKDTKMLIWLGKQYLGQKDNTNDEFKNESFVIECDIPDK